MTKKYEKNKIGETIKKLRAERGWSRRTLGELSGVSGACIWSLEKKHINPSALSVYKLACALGVSVDYLIEGEKNKTYINVGHLFFDDFVKEEIKGKGEVSAKIHLVIYDAYKSDIWNTLHAEATQRGYKEPWLFISSLFPKSIDSPYAFEYQITKCAIKLILEENL